LRHEGFAPFQPHLAFTLAHVVAHRRFSDRGVGKFAQDPAMDAPGRVALLARRAAVLVKHLVDEVRHRAQLRLASFRVMLRRWQRACDRPPDNPPMNAELCRYARDVPIPNSCSRRSCSNNSTLAFQSTKGPPIRSG
jgi:hypothetical protein